MPISIARNDGIVYATGLHFTYQAELGPRQHCQSALELVRAAALAAAAAAASMNHQQQNLSSRPLDYPSLEDTAGASAGSAGASGGSTGAAGPVPMDEGNPPPALSEAT